MEEQGLDPGSLLPGPEQDRGYPRPRKQVLGGHEGGAFPAGVLWTLRCGGRGRRSVTGDSSSGRPNFRPGDIWGGVLAWCVESVLGFKDTCPVGLGDGRVVVSSLLG